MRDAARALGMAVLVALVGGFAGLALLDIAARWAVAIP